MSLDRIDDCTHFRGDKRPDDILYLDLSNGHRLGLRQSAFAAVVPVLHDPTGRLTVRDEAGKLRAAPDAGVLGSAFSVFPQFGLFATAAHVLPSDPERAIGRNEIGVPVPTPGGSHVILPFKAYAANMLNDVAVCWTGISFKDFEYPYLPLPLEQRDLSSDETVLYAGGYPETTYTSSTIDLHPTAFAGQMGARRVAEDRTIIHRGEPHVIRGRFIHAAMDVRRGFSGGPLCASKIVRTRVVRTKERNVLGGRKEERHLLEGQVVGIMSWRRADDDPTFTDGFFADATVAIDMPLPFLQGRTLRDLYANAQRRDLPEIQL